MDVAPALEQMLAAIGQERAAVRSALGALDGLRPIGLRDGVRLVREPGAQVYRFECELDFLLADGTRVQVLAPGAQASGEVIDHDPALGHVGFVLREDLGEQVAQAQLVFDSTRLLDLLHDRVEAILASQGPEGSAARAAARRALDFLEGTLAPKPPASVARPGLSQSQSAALSFVVGQDAAYLWGPPGTGKTQTVAHLVHELIERGERVLLLAHTNIATDTALLRVLREKKLSQGAVVRVGWAGEELQPFGVGLDAAAEARLRANEPDAAREMEELCQLVAQRASRPPALLTSGRPPLGRRFRAALDLVADISLVEEADVVERAVRLTSLLAAIEREIVQGAQLVASTLTSLYSNKLLRGHLADTVVVDEASIASLVLTFLAALSATRRTIAVGDFMQLPAIVQSEEPAAQLWLGRHVFASAGCDRAEGGHPLRAMLHEQWRMPPQISRVVSRLFYAGRLQDAPGVMAHAHSGPAMLIVDTSRVAPVTETLGGGSKRNAVHARIVASLVKGAKATGVAVIAPYRAQVRRIRDEVRAVAPARLERSQVEVFTVHRFQGRDRELVIFDLVEAPGTRCRFLDELQNADAPNLINVAMSRAKERLIVVAHLQHFAEALGSSALVNRLFAQMRLAGALEVVAGDARDEAMLGQFLAGKG